MSLKIVTKPVGLFLRPNATFSYLLMTNTTFTLCFNHGNVKVRCQQGAHTIEHTQQPSISGLDGDRLPPPMLIDLPAHPRPTLAATDFRVDMTRLHHCMHCGPIGGDPPRVNASNGAHHLGLSIVTSIATRLTGQTGEEGMRMTLGRGRRLRQEETVRHGLQEENVLLVARREAAW